MCPYCGGYLADVLSLASFHLECGACGARVSPDEDHEPETEPTCPAPQLDEDERYGDDPADQG